MSALLWRVVFAVIVVVLIWALLPPLFVVIGLEPTAALIQVLRICIAGIAILYIIKGPPLPL